MPVLACKRVIFYSPADEAVFFAFAERITAVRRVQGVGDSILLHVTARPSATALRDLLALFHRYRIRGMSQFATLSPQPTPVVYRFVCLLASPCFCPSSFHLHAQHLTTRSSEQRLGSVPWQRPSSPASVAELGSVLGRWANHPTIGRIP